MDRAFFLMNCYLFLGSKLETDKLGGLFYTDLNSDGDENPKRNHNILPKMQNP
jgi:hypothetical protein